jgi:hypothetical protein
MVGAIEDALSALGKEAGWNKYLCHVHGSRERTRFHRLPKE